MADEDKEKKPVGEESTDATKQKDSDGLDLDEEEEDEEDDEGGDGKGDDDGEPVTLTKKELDAYVENKLNQRFAKRRHDSKDTKKPYQPNRKEADRDPVIGSRVERLEQVEVKRQFGYEHGLAPSEVDMIFKFNPKPTRKTLQDPFVQGGLEKMRAQKNAEDNIPSGSTAKSFTVGGKNWNDLSDEDKAKHFGAHQQAILAGKAKR